MKNEEPFNVHSTFLVHTALIVGFMLAVSLGSFAPWLDASTLGSATTDLNSSSALSQKK